MPFLRDLRTWGDDGTSNIWERVTTQGPFLALEHSGGAVRYLQHLRGVDASPYRIVTAKGGPHYEVATAATPDELSDLLQRLGSLSLDDVLGVALDETLERRARVAKIIDFAECAAASQDPPEGPSPLGEVLKRNACLEGSVRDLESVIRSKDAEIVDLRSQLDEAREQMVADLEASWAKERTESDAQWTGHYVNDSESDLRAAQGCMTQSQPKEILPDPNELRLPRPQSQGVFAESLLRATKFDTSPVKRFWQLAQASYHMGQYKVIEGREMWSVIMYAWTTNTKVIGRVLRDGQLEVGFRGTVSEDAQGYISKRNWDANLTRKVVPLDDQLRHGQADWSAAMIHEGFHHAYLSVRGALLEWLHEQSVASKPQVRFAGHSLGGAIATLAAVDIKLSGWPVVAVVTFGSPKVGTGHFKQIYEELELSWCTARYVNEADPIPWLPRAVDGFRHVVAHRSLNYKTKARWSTPKLAAHSMVGNPLSYFQALHDYIDFMSAGGKVVTADGGMLADMLAGAGAVQNAEEKCLVHSIQSDVRSVQDDVARLFSALSVAVERMGKEMREGHVWDSVMDLRAICRTLRNDVEVLPKWDGRSLPGWLERLHVAENKVYEIALNWAQGFNSQYIVTLVQVLVQEAALQLWLLHICQAPQWYVKKQAIRLEETIAGLLRQHEAHLWQHAELLASLPCLRRALSELASVVSTGRAIADVEERCAAVAHIVDMGVGAKVAQEALDDYGGDLFGKAVQSLARGSDRENSVVFLAVALKTNKVTELNLDLSNTHLSDEDGTHIGQALKLNTTVQAVSLKRNRLGENAGSAIGDALGANATLTALDLSYNSLAEKAGTAIGEFLGANSAITELNLSHNSLGRSACAAIGASLGAHRALATLDLNGNRFCGGGGAAIGEALRTNASLTALSLECCSLCDGDGAAIGESLGKNSTLTALSLSGNHLGQSAGTAIGEALMANAALAALRLESCGLAEGAGVAIGKALGTNAGLTALSLSSNCLGCGDPAWRSLLRRVGAWRDGTQWPPLVAAAAGFPTEGDRELAEWGTSAGSVACSTGVDHFVRSLALRRESRAASGHPCPVGVLTALIHRTLPYVMRDRQAAQRELLRDIESLLLSTPVGVLLFDDWPVWALLRYMVAWLPAENSGFKSSIIEDLSVSRQSTADPKAMGTCNRTVVTVAHGHHLSAVSDVLRQWCEVARRSACQFRVTLLATSSAVVRKCSRSRSSWPGRIKCVMVHRGALAAKYAVLMAALRHGSEAVLSLDLQTALLRDPFPVLAQVASRHGAPAVACRQRHSGMLGTGLLFARPGSEPLLASVASALAAEPLRQEVDLLNEAVFHHATSESRRNRESGLASTSVLHKDFRVAIPEECGTELATADGWRAHPLAIAGDAGVLEPVLLGRAPWAIFSDRAAPGLADAVSQSRVEPQSSPLPARYRQERVTAVSYAHRCCRRSQARNLGSARAAGAFAAFALRHESLIRGTGFERQHARVLAEPRGAGWWLWKPLAVRWALARAAPGDVVAYLDAGNRFRPNISLPELVAPLLAGTDVTAARLGCCLERHWTARCTLRRLGEDGRSAIVDTEQVAANFVLLRHTALALRFVEEWLAAAEDTAALTGRCGGNGRQLGEYPGFCEHRADQSIFSVLFKRYGFEALSDEEAEAMVSYDRDRT